MLKNKEVTRFGQYDNKFGRFVYFQKNCDLCTRKLETRPNRLTLFNII